MNEHVSQMMTALCQVVRTLPIGTNLGLLHLLWALVSGQLLLSRGAVIPALHQLGLPDRAVRRAWQALWKGGWEIGALLVNWEAVVLGGPYWVVRQHGGYCALVIDTTGFWRPRLQRCPTKHFHHSAGKALPAILLGIIGRVGQVGQQRLLLPLRFLRAAAGPAAEAALKANLVSTAKALMQALDVLVTDGGFALELLLSQGVPRFIAKQPRNCTARSAQPPAYPGKGRPGQRGDLVRPLARTYRGRTLPATPPDRSATWEEDGVTLRADCWDNLVLRSTKAAECATAARFSIVVLYDPRFTEPLVVATNLTLAAADIRRLYLDRWPVEQLPLSAKQMIGAQRAFVHAEQVCQRLPELALLAGSMLSFLAAQLPPIPTGFWDRQPQATPGRLRRVLGRGGFPHDYALPAEIRQKASVTAHLPKGILAHRRTKRPAVGAAAP